MKIPFVSFLPMEHELESDLRGAFDRVFTHSWYIECVEDKNFENVFDAYHGVRHCVGADNGLYAQMLALKALGIMTNKHYPIPMHLQECYRDLAYKKSAFPLAEEISQTELSKPMFYGMTENEIQFVINMINVFWSK